MGDDVSNLVGGLPLGNRLLAFVDVAVLVTLFAAILMLAGCGPADPYKEYTQRRFSFTRVCDGVDLIDDHLTKRQYLSKAQGGFIDVTPLPEGNR